MIIKFTQWNPPSGTLQSLRINTPHLPEDKQKQLLSMIEASRFFEIIPPPLSLPLFYTLTISEKQHTKTLFLGPDSPQPLQELLSYLSQTHP